MKIGVHLISKYPIEFFIAPKKSKNLKLGAATPKPRNLTKKTMAFKAQITGNLGRKPELRYLDSGSTVCDFSLAVKQWKKDAPTRWVKVTAWGKSAEFAGNFLDKGDKVVVFGRVEPPEMYDGKNGLTVIEKITSEDLEVVSSKGSGQTQPVTQPATVVHDATPSSVEPSDEIPF